VAALAGAVACGGGAGSDPDAPAEVTGEVDPGCGLATPAEWPCDPGCGAGCAAGLACFPSDQGPVCLSPGSVADGLACAHANDCLAGSACVRLEGRSSCAGLCALAAGSSASCAAQCPEAYGALSGLPGVGFCTASDQPRACDLLLQDCPGDQGCYYSDQGVMCAPVAAGLDLNDPCVNANDCLAGLLCVNGACREICATWSPSCVPGAKACVALPAGGGAGACMP
jgi:hypothetical protein